MRVFSGWQIILIHNATLYYIRLNYDLFGSNYHFEHYLDI